MADRDSAYMSTRGAPSPSPPQGPLPPPADSRTGLTRRIGAGAAVVTTLASLLVFPSVRASAQAFLDLFRVVNFTAVPVDPDRIRRLSDEGLDLEQLIGRHVEVVADPGPARTFLSVEAAGADAGFPVRVPAALPPGLALTGIEASGEHAARITGDTSLLQGMLDALGITDLRAPDALDGQTALLRVPPVVHLSYDYSDQHVDFYQGPSPQVTLPAGVDLPVLGEIGLRIFGLDAAEAHRLAQAIDWRSTFIVPVPPTATTFRQVQVGGQRGLLIETARASTGRAVNAVLWSADGFVYGLRGELSSVTLLHMAVSVR